MSGSDLKDALSEQGKLGKLDCDLSPLCFNVPHRKIKNVNIYDLPLSFPQHSAIVFFSQCTPRPMTDGWIKQHILRSIVRGHEYRAWNPITVSHEQVTRNQHHRIPSIELWMLISKKLKSNESNMEVLGLKRSHRISFYVPRRLIRKQNLDNMMNCIKDS